MVTSARLPVLWLCGAPATGKSTVAWQVFSDLADQGLCVGYLDIDQIGMLAPPPDADSRCHRFKVDNLAAMVRNYRTAGTQVLVISGVIDTTGRDAVGVARDAATLVTAAPSTPDAQELLECAAGDVTIIIGPRAVGKSSVSWGMAMRRWVSGECTVYVDLDQVGFLRPAPSDGSLQAANLGVIWRNALSRGANRLIANGMVTTNEDLAILRHAVRPARVQALRLAANPDTLWERIRARSAGSPARLINDDLENAAPSVQRHVHRVAVAQNLEYAASNLGDYVIDTTNLCIEEAVEQAL